MNSLSWFVYFAEIIPTTANIFAVFAFCLSVLYLVLSIGYGTKMDELRSLHTNRYGIRQSDEDKEETQNRIDEEWRWFGRVTVIMGFFFLLFTAIAILLPSRTTLILIAASEFGEKIVTSERVVGIVDPSVELLKAWIESQTRELSSKGKR